MFLSSFLVAVWFFLNPVNSAVCQQLGTVYRASNDAGFIASDSQFHHFDDSQRTRIGGRGDIPEKYGFLVSTGADFDTSLVESGAAHMAGVTVETLWPKLTSDKPQIPCGIGNYTLIRDCEYSSGDDLRGVGPKWTAAWWRWERAEPGNHELDPRVSDCTRINDVLGFVLAPRPLGFIEGAQAGAALDRFIHHESDRGEESVLIECNNFALIVSWPLLRSGDSTIRSYHKLIPARNISDNSAGADLGWCSIAPADGKQAAPEGKFHFVVHGENASVEVPFDDASQNDAIRCAGCSILASANDTSWYELIATEESPEASKCDLPAQLASRE